MNRPQKPRKHISGSPVFLYGSGRSGTTWLEERIANALNAEVIFEPLKETLSPVSHKYAFNYLEMNQESEDLKNYFEGLINGECSSLWTRYRILPDRLIPKIATITNKAELKAWIKRFPESYTLFKRYHPTIKRKKKIVKLIRANLMMQWLVDTFKTGLHVGIIRHPAAVIESRMRLDRLAKKAGILSGNDDWDARQIVKRIISQRLPDVLLDGIKKIGSIEKLSLFECHCMLWCLENKLLVDFRDERMLLVYYEDILSQSHKTWRDLAAILSVEESKLKNNMDRPSQQASRVFYNKNGKTKNDSIDKLKQVEGASAIEKIQEYLDIFSFQEYLAHNLSPKH